LKDHIPHFHHFNQCYLDKASMKHQQRSPVSPSGEESNPAPFLAPVNPTI
jgi:hypothetical protein